jgi:hypothetical protein
MPPVAVRPLEPGEALEVGPTGDGALVPSSAENGAGGSNPGVAANANGSLPYGGGNPALYGGASVLPSGAANATMNGLGPNGLPPPSSTDLSQPSRRPPAPTAPANPTGSPATIGRTERPRFPRNAGANTAIGPNAGRKGRDSWCRSSDQRDARSQQPARRAGSPNIGSSTPTFVRLPAQRLHRRPERNADPATKDRDPRSRTSGPTELRARSPVARPFRSHEKHSARHPPGASMTERRFLEVGCEPTDRVQSRRPEHPERAHARIQTGCPTDLRALLHSSRTAR